jgi:hypothetical protein
VPATVVTAALTSTMRPTSNEGVCE